MDESSDQNTQVLLNIFCMAKGCRCLYVVQFGQCNILYASFITLTPPTFCIMNVHTYVCGICSCSFFFYHYIQTTFIVRCSHNSIHENHRSVRCAIIIFYISLSCFLYEISTIQDNMRLRSVCLHIRGCKDDYVFETTSLQRTRETGRG